MRIVVVGSVNMDLVVTTDTLPRPGETVLGADFSTIPGGKGANQAIAIARAGGECDFIGAVGQDAFGDQLRDNLVAHGVGVDRLRLVPRPSGVALIAVDAQAENLIVVAPGANGSLSRLDDEDLRLIEAADVVVCQLEVPLSAVTQAATAAKMFILNAAPARAVPRELLAAVDLLVVNQIEARSLGDLINLVPRVVVTLGAAGVEYTDRRPGPPHVAAPEVDAVPAERAPEVNPVAREVDAVSAERETERAQSMRVAAPEVEAVDATGAGDAFTGALAVALARGWPMREALRWACAAGAVCATKRGAGMPTAQEIDALLHHLL